MKKTVAILLVTVAIIILLSLESIVDKILSIPNGEWYLLFGFMVLVVGLFTYLNKRK